MRKNLARVTIVVPLVLLMAMLGPGPAFASPLKSAVARAYGLSASGLLEIAPTPAPAVAGFPPEAAVQQADLLDVPVSPLVFSGTAVTAAATSRESTLQSSTFPGRYGGSAQLKADLQVQGGGTLPAAYNARAYSKIEGLRVLGDIEEITGVGLVDASAVEAEALVSCVDGRPVFVHGSSIVDLNLGGSPIVLNPLLGQVIDLVGTPLAGILEIRRDVVTVTPEGIAVDALQIKILSTLEVVTLGHAEVQGSAGTCEPVDKAECEDLIDNDGDGKIDFIPPPGQVMDPDCISPKDDSEAGLVRTGGWGPGYGLAALAGAGLLMLAAYRLRRSKITT